MLSCETSLEILIVMGLAGFLLKLYQLIKEGKFKW